MVPIETITLSRSVPLPFSDQLRKCGSCKTWKPLTEFGGRNKKGFLPSWCKLCKKRKSRESYQKHSIKRARAQNELRAARIANGKCRDCGQNPPNANGVRCPVCADKFLKRGRRRAARARKEGTCRTCARTPRPGYRSCRHCVDVAVERYRQLRKKHKTFVFDYFGGECKGDGCGERDYRVLTLDHVNGDGHKEKGRGSELYRVLYRKLTKGKLHNRELQLLCFNCHAKKDLASWWLK